MYINFYINEEIILQIIRRVKIRLMPVVLQIWAIINKNKISMQNFFLSLSLLNNK